MYSIEISYSWGDCEDPYGLFWTEEEAYKRMCELAGREAYVQNDEFGNGKPCTVYFNAFHKAIDLHYGSDGTWCYYRVKKWENKMTLDEYNKKIDSYKEQLDKSLLRSEWEKIYEELSKFQSSYMQHVLDKYEKSVDSDTKQYIYNLLYHAVMLSETGSSIVDVETKEIADEIENIIFDEIGDYLLDCNIYPENDHWVIDCMFGGAYVPYWDGWGED